MLGLSNIGPRIKPWGTLPGDGIFPDGDKPVALTHCSFCQYDMIYSVGYSAKIVGNIVPADDVTQG